MQEPNQPPAQAPPKLEPMESAYYQCDREDCGRTFASAPALRMHQIRMHGKGWSTTKNFRGARGGKPPRAIKKPARRAYGPGTGTPWTAEHREKFIATIKRKRKAAQFTPQKFFNGIAERMSVTVAKPEDQLGDAAKAILLCAKVLRGTMTALKLP